MGFGGNALLLLRLAILLSFQCRTAIYLGSSQLVETRRM